MAVMATMVDASVPVRLVRGAIRWGAAEGIDLSVVRDAAGLTPAQLRSDAGLCTVEQMSRFVRELWRLTDDELFGVCAHAVPRGSWALLSHNLIHGRDLGDVLQRAERFLPALPGIPTLTFDVSTDDVTIRLEIEASDDPAHLLTELCLAVVHRFSAWLTGSRLTPKAMQLPYDIRRSARQFAHIYDVVPTVGSPALVFDRAVLSRPVVRDEADLATYLRNSPELFFSQRDYGCSVTDQVRALLVTTPVDAWPDSSELAASLAYSEPHLRRLLRGEGASLTGLRDEVRRDLAVSALVAGRSTIEVAQLVGFSEPSAFRRAFRRWVDAAPSDYRP